MGVPLISRPVTLRCELLRASKGDGPSVADSSFEARRRGSHLRMTGIMRHSLQSAHLRILAAHFARGLQNSFRSSPKRGRREHRVRAAPAVSCAMYKEMRTRAYRAAESIRHSLRNGFTAYSVLSPVIGFLATVAGGTDRRLDASTEASGPHDFAVRVGTVRRRHL